MSEGRGGKASNEGTSGYADNGTSSLVGWSKQRYSYCYTIILSAERGGVGGGGDEQEHSYSWDNFVCRK